MICQRCGSHYEHDRESRPGYCFHCIVALDIDEATGGAISKGFIAEGFPEWQKPTKKDYAQERQARML